MKNKYVVVIVSIMAIMAISYTFVSNYSENNSNVNISRDVNIIENNLGTKYSGIDMELVNSSVDKMYKINTKVTYRNNTNQQTYYVTEDNRVVTGFAPLKRMDNKNAKGSNPQKLAGGYKDNEKQVCKEDGKLNIYIFTGTKCPFCAVERVPFVEALSKYGEFNSLEKVDVSGISTYSFVDVTYTSDQISLHMYEDSGHSFDSLSELPSKVRKLKKKYLGGGVPSIMIGCKYYRTGAYSTSSRDIQSKPGYDLTEGQRKEVDDLNKILKRALER